MSQGVVEPGGWTVRLLPKFPHPISGVGGWQKEFTTPPSSAKMPFGCTLRRSTRLVRVCCLATKRGLQVECPLLLTMKGLNPQSPLPTQTDIPGELMLGATRNVGLSVALNTFFKTLTSCHTRVVARIALNTFFKTTSGILS